MLTRKITVGLKLDTGLFFRIKKNLWETQKKIKIASKNSLISLENDRKKNNVRHKNSRKKLTKALKFTKKIVDVEIYYNRLKF